MALEGFSHEMSDAQTPLLHLAELKPHFAQEKVQHNAEEKKAIAEDCQPFTPVTIEIMGSPRYSLSCDLCKGVGQENQEKERL